MRKWGLRIGVAIGILLVAGATWLAYNQFKSPSSGISSVVRQIKPQCYYLTRKLDRGLEGSIRSDIAYDLSLGIVNQVQRVVVDQEVIDASSTRTINLQTHDFTYLDRTSPLYLWAETDCSKEEVASAIEAANALQPAYVTKNPDLIKVATDKYLKPPQVTMPKTPTCAYAVPLKPTSQESAAIGNLEGFPVIVLEAKPFTAWGAPRPFYTQYNFVDVTGYSPPYGVVEGLSQYEISFTPCVSEKFNFFEAFKNVKQKDPKAPKLDLTNLKDNTELFPTVVSAPPAPKAVSTAGVSSARPQSQPTQTTIPVQTAASQSGGIDWWGWLIKGLLVAIGLVSIRLFATRHVARKAGASYNPPASRGTSTTIQGTAVRNTPASALSSSLIDESQIPPELKERGDRVLWLMMANLLEEGKPVNQSNADAFFTAYNDAYPSNTIQRIGNLADFQSDFVDHHVIGADGLIDEDHGLANLVKYLTS